MTLNRISLVALLITAALGGCGNSGFAPETTADRNPEKPDAELSKFTTAVISTSMGDIQIELYWDAAPRTCANFVKLARKKFYDGIVFHRVIPNFMIQTGDPEGNGTGGPGYKFEDEINADALGLDKEKVGENQAYGRDRQQALQKIAAKLGIKSREEAMQREEEIKKIWDETANWTVKQLYQASGYTYTKELKSRPALRGALAMANSGPDTNGSQFFINVADTVWLNGKHTVFAGVTGGQDIADAISKADRGQNDKPTTEIRINSIEFKTAQ